MVNVGKYTIRGSQGGYALGPNLLVEIFGPKLAEFSKPNLRLMSCLGRGIMKWDPLFWSNYSDLTRPHPKWWFSKGNHLISGKCRVGR